MNTIATSRTSARTVLNTKNSVLENDCNLTVLVVKHKALIFLEQHPDSCNQNQIETLMSVSQCQGKRLRGKERSLTSFISQNVL